MAAIDALICVQKTQTCHELSPLFVISVLLVDETGKSITTTIPRDILEYAEASDDYDYVCNLFNSTMSKKFVCFMLKMSQIIFDIFDML